MNTYFKILFIFLFGFLVFSSSVSATEIEEPVSDQEETSSESVVPESESESNISVSESEVPVSDVDSTFDFSSLEQGINNLNESFDSVLPVFRSLPISDFYKDYFRGIIYNLPWATEYLLYTDFDDQGIEHYYVFYNLLFDDSGNLILGSYPCLDVYLVGDVIIKDMVTKELSSLPTVGFGSFFPYANLVDPPNVGPGKDFTAAQKVQIIQQNKNMNGGVVRSDLSGVELVQPQKSMKGVTPSPLEWQIDHIIPKSAGGTNSFANAQVLSRLENRIKWDH